MLTEPPHKSRGISAPPRGAQRVRRVFVSVAPSELTSFERIKWALRNILTDVKRHNGIYPYSAGAPKIADVLKRAGLSERFLEKQGGNLLREKQKAHYKKLIKRVLRRVKSGRYFPIKSRTGHQHSERSASWLALQAQLNGIKQAWIEAELEYIDAQNRVGELDKLANELRAENDRLLGLLAGAGIHVL